MNIASHEVCAAKAKASPPHTRLMESIKYHSWCLYACAGLCETPWPANRASAGVACHRSIQRMQSRIDMHQHLHSSKHLCPLLKHHIMHGMLRPASLLQSYPCMVCNGAVPAEHCRCCAMMHIKLSRHRWHGCTDAALSTKIHAYC